EEQTPEKEKQGNKQNSSSRIAIRGPSLIVRFNNFIEDLFIKIFGGEDFKKTAKLPDAETFKKLEYSRQEEELRKIAKDAGSEKAWNFFKKTFQGDAGSTGHIHDLAHFSGLLLFEEKGFEGIKECTADFAFGCYHGFLDKAFAKNLDRLLDAEKACLTLGSENSGPVASCIHGIGHGVASFYSTIKLEESLGTCRNLTSGNRYCFDGVFMEFVRNAQDSFFKTDDPYYPCNKLEENFAYAYSFECGRNQPSLLMGRFKMGFDEVINICANSQSRPFKEGCFDSLGFALAATGDPAQIISGCQKIGIDEYISKCIKASAGELVFQEVPGWFEKSKQVCSGYPPTQTGCLENVNRLIKDYNKKITFNFGLLENGEDQNTYVREQLKVCYDLGGRDSCYRQAAQALYESLGLSNNLSILKVNEQYPEVYARCHEVTHYLSRLEYERLGNIAKVYSQCDATCHGGCYHGTLEAYLKEKTEEKNFNLQNEFAKVCGKESDYQRPIEYNECFHGLGHAAMFVTDMEVFDSLKLCDTIKGNEYWERCLTGVFMENSSSSTSFDHKSKYIKEDDPFYPCNSLDEKYQAVCWQYQSSYFAIISNQDWQKVAGLCLKIPAKYQERCFRTIGTNQVGFTSSLEIMKKDCDIMPTGEFRDICVKGVVSSLAYRFVGNTQKMIDFCILANPENRQSCYKQMASGLLDWDKDENVAKKECEKIPDPQGAS
ncbi:MAG: hypothetical protein AAB801_01600, partial [Patescibacteria group bacterium]